MSRQRRFDVALAAVLLVLSQLECWLGSFDERPLLAVVCLLMTAPLVLRREHPLLVASGVLVVFAVGQAAQGDVTEMASGTLPVLVATYTVAAYEPWRRALVGGAIAAAAAAGSVLASPEDPTTANFVYAGLVVGVAWSVGRVLSSRHEQLDELAEQNRLLEEQTAEAVRLERARIARELHDVVAHGVSVMVLQAGGAEGVVESSPQDAKAALQSIQSSGRAALVELRRMLAVLRDDGGPDEELRPPPGLQDLPALVEGMQAAGLDARLSLDAPADVVPAAVGLSAYRIVQESLTNALKHAGPAVAQVTVRAAGGQLVVEVRDNGKGGSVSLPGAGQGLVGMRERVSVFGGRLDIATDDGFRVRAELPLRETS
jgi:signal transduction histidine kinase